VQRVAIVGSGGAGKSTFSRKLSELTSLPLIHLDEHHWLPGWVEPPKEEWREAQRTLAAADRWIIEGNYRNTFHIRFERADTVIVIALPRRVCVYRVLKRVVKNWHKPTQAPQCPEHFDFKFLKWIWRFPFESRPFLDEALALYQGRFEVIELSTKREVREYLDSLN
jgi:adenylate kinase family enzyme